MYVVLIIIHTYACIYMCAYVCMLGKGTNGGALRRYTRLFFVFVFSFMLFPLIFFFLLLVENITDSYGESA